MEINSSRFARVNNFRFRYLIEFELERFGSLGPTEQPSASSLLAISSTTAVLSVIDACGANANSGSSMEKAFTK